MGLFDRSRPVPTHEADLLRRIGRLEADVESIKLQWVDFKDVLNRMVQRLEKRDQRAAERAEVASAAAAPPAQLVDATTARILERRATRGNRNGLSE